MTLMQDMLREIDPLPMYADIHAALAALTQTKEAD